MVYRRKTTSTRRRTYRKKPVPKAVKSYVRSKVRAVQQVKEYRTGGTHNLYSSAAGFYIGSSSVSYILKGDELYQREANAVYIRSVHIMWNIENNLATQSRQIRVLLVKENTPNSTISGTGLWSDQNFVDVDANGQISNLSYPVNTKKYQVFFDRRINVPPNSSSVQSIRTGVFKIPIKRRVIFYANSAATTETSTGHFYLITVIGDTTTSASALEFNFQARVFFTDSMGFRKIR